MFYNAAYGLALKAMFQLEPERIHVLISNCMRVLNRVTPLHRALSKLTFSDPLLEQEVFGLKFPRPLGLAAGFDKHASAPDAWAAVGFGYAELGTITAFPQPGNPQPRLFRLPQDKAILNRMGFNNGGAAKAAKNLRARTTSDVIGINIGKNKVTPSEDAVANYRQSASVLGNLADYVAVNVSSPNTPGLRDLQAVESLRPILEAVKEATTAPVLVKIAPDLNDADIDAVADLAVELDLAGIIATNTTISRDGLTTNESKVSAMGAGGISGPPVKDAAVRVLRRIYERVGDSLVLVGVGGISTPEDAWERIGAGASLLQGYTGLIYGGPGWVDQIHRGLAQQLKAHGLSNISEAVGKELPFKR